MTRQAIARRERKEAERRRTFVPRHPGNPLPKLTLRQRVYARGRLSPDYNDAVQVVAAEMERKGGHAPLDAATLARVEQVAADIRLGRVARGKPQRPKLSDLAKRWNKHRRIAS